MVRSLGGRLRPPLLFALSATAALLVLDVLSYRRGSSEGARAAPQTTSAGTATEASRDVSSDSLDVSSRVRRPSGGRPAVIWLGLDAFDFELVDRLAAEGGMPNWRRLEAEGYTAYLESFVPILSPIVWTTLATGVGPDVHRVLDFQQVDPETGQKVPISGSARALPAIWNVASASGQTVGVVGWWATHPAEEVNGFFVSDHACPILFEGLPKRNRTFPASLSTGVDQILTREATVTSEDLAQFVGVSAADIAAERQSDDGLSNDLVLLARSIGATRAESRIARELYDRNLPDLMMLYLEGTDVVGHLFASELPPKMSCVSDADFSRYRRTVDDYYALVDRVLGQWMRRAEEDGATLIVNSDHGFKWGRDRSCEMGSANPETAGFWHRLDGVFAAWGARVKRTSRRGRATVFDVEPTVAALLDLPVDRRSRGSPIRAAFSDITTPAREDFATAVPVRRLVAEPVSEKESSDYAKNLRTLGYLSGSRSSRVPPSRADRPGLTEAGWNNLGLYLSAAGGDSNLASAEDAYTKALALSPDYVLAMLNLAVLHRIRGDDRQAIRELFRALAAGQANPERTVLDWALYYGAKGKVAFEREVLERGARQYPESEEIRRAFGLKLFRENDCRRADATLARFETISRDTRTLNALALIRTCLGRQHEAMALFRHSLQIDPEQQTVVQSLAILEGAPEHRR